MKRSFFRRVAANSVMFFAAVLIFSACATMNQGGTGAESKASFDLNPLTVASATPEPIGDGGYAIQIVLTDAGWDAIRRMGSRPGSVLLMKVNGRVITEEVAIGSQFPREFLWTRNLGVNDFSREEAEMLAKEMTQVSSMK